MTHPLLRTLLRTPVSIETLIRRLLRTLLRSTSFKEPSKNPSIGNENSARSFSDRSFFEPPWGHGFGSWMSAPKCLFFPGFREGLTEVFAPGRPPGYPRRRPPDIRPQNLLFGLLFRSRFFAPAILQKCVGGFLLYKFWRIFAGIFLEDFSGHFSPTKMRRKNPARKSAKKSGGPKIKIREKSVLPKPDPNDSKSRVRLRVPPWCAPKLDGLRDPVMVFTRRQGLA